MANASQSKIFRKWKVDAAGLSSAEREALGASVNEGLFFSAHVSDAELLEDIKLAIEETLEGNNQFLDRKAFMENMRKRFGEAVGNTSQSYVSNRLKLLWEQNVARAGGKIDRTSATSQASLLSYPYWELSRIEPRKVPRDWIARWLDAGGTLSAGDRMVAPIEDEIWERLSRFGTPYPPFDYNSGMGVRLISLREGRELLVEPERS